MAATKKITREIILEGAFALLREQGIKNLNARNIAAYVGCSTQPIYSSFRTLEELMTELEKKCHEVFSLYVEKAKDAENPLTEFLFQYFKYASYEKNLFEFFMANNKRQDVHSFRLHEGEDVCNQYVHEHYQLSDKEARLYMISCWSFVHGLAVLSNQGPLTFSERDIRHLLERECEAQLYMIMKERKDNG